MPVLCINFFGGLQLVIRKIFVNFRYKHYNIWYNIGDAELHLSWWNLDWGLFKIVLLVFSESTIRLFVSNIWIGDLFTIYGSGKLQTKTWIKSPSHLLKQKLHTSLNIYIFRDMEFKHVLTKMFKFMKKWMLN